MVDCPPIMSKCSESCLNLILFTFYGLFLSFGFAYETQMLALELIVKNKQQI